MCQFFKKNVKKNFAQTDLTGARIFPLWFDSFCLTALSVWSKEQFPESSVKKFLIWKIFSTHFSYFFMFKALYPISVLWKTKRSRHLIQFRPKNSSFFFQNFSKLWYFVTKIVLTYCEKQNVLVVKKNFWNSRLKA